MGRTRRVGRTKERMVQDMSAAEMMCPECDCLEWCILCDRNHYNHFIHACTNGHYWSVKVEAE